MSVESYNPRAILSESDISEILTQDLWRMDVLRAAERLDLPDWWIGAGFLRNLIWNTIEGKPSETTRDVDLVYFDSTNVQPEHDWAYDEKMKKEYPFADWEIRNQARMHYVNNFMPYTSTAGGIAHWVETATCVAVKLDRDNFKYLFCHGTADLFGLTARPIEAFKTPDLINEFRNRVVKKQWQQKWPHLKVTEE